MSFYAQLSHVSVEYDSAAGALFRDLSIQFPVGWTGIVGANGCGKTSLLNLVAGKSGPVSGTVRTGGRCVLCEQEVSVPPEQGRAFLESPEPSAIRLRIRLAIQPDWIDRWETLSMGERKKIQIGAALWQEPEILCIDEPTNHLDYAARNELISALRQFNGIGILVSHDRELLDLLCSQCLFMRTGKTVLRTGGVTAGSEEERRENENRFREYQLMKRDLQQSKRELQRRKEKAQKAERNNSKRKIDRKDFDAKGKIDAARVSGRSRSASDLAGAQAKLVAGKTDSLDSFELPEYHKLGLSIPYGSYSAKNSLLAFPGEELPLGTSGKLNVPVLEIGSSDRIALTGINGSGKSTLLRRLLDCLNLEPDQYLYLPQELDGEIRKKIYAEVQSLSKNEFSKVMSIVASLGSSPRRVLDSQKCSPGEWRKLFFGLGVLREINLIILDEPTNHLDLPSIECLEAALKDCSCAMLLVSHDMRFLKTLCSIHWEIEALSGKENRLRKKFW